MWPPWRSLFLATDFRGLLGSVSCCGQHGRWIAEVPDLPGVMVYGATRQDAVAKVEVLALHVIADRLDHGEAIPELDELFAVPA